MHLVINEVVRLAAGTANGVDGVLFAQMKRKAVVGHRAVPDNGFYARRLKVLSNQ